MSVRRLLSVAIATLVVTAGLTLGPAPARAEGATTYLCTADGLLRPVTVVVDSTVGVVVDGTPLQSTTDPLTATVDTVLNDLVGVVDGLLGDLLSPLAALLRHLFALLSPTGNVADGVVRSLVCTVDGATAPLTVPLTDLISDFLAGVVPGAGTGGGTTGGTGGGTGGGTSGGGTAGGSTGGGHVSYNLCTLTLPAKAGARGTRLSVTPRKRKVAAGRHVVVTIEASYRKAGKRKRAGGQALLCDGTSYLGYIPLKKGSAVVRLPKLEPGRHRVLVRYVGSAKARPKDKRVTVRVKG